MLCHPVTFVLWWCESSRKLRSRMPRPVDPVSSLVHSSTCSSRSRRSWFSTPICRFHSRSNTCTIVKRFFCSFDWYLKIWRRCRYVSIKENAGIFCIIQIQAVKLCFTKILVLSWWCWLMQVYLYNIIMVVNGSSFSWYLNSCLWLILMWYLNGTLFVGNTIY